MNHHFERVSLDDGKQVVERLRGLSVDQIITLLGPPNSVFSPASEERDYGSYRETIDFVRGLEFTNVTDAVRSLLVYERVDGKLEFNFRGGRLNSDAEMA